MPRSGKRQACTISEPGHRCTQPATEPDIGMYQKLLPSLFTHFLIHILIRLNKISVKAIHPNIIIHSSKGDVADVALDMLDNWDAYRERYNLLANNCEHLATFCKTGKHTSDQVQV